MKMWQEVIDQLFYPNFRDNWDDLIFRKQILSRLKNGRQSVLDLGAGAGIVEQMDFRGHAERICGVDLDPRVVENPFIDEGKVGTAERIPYPDQTFDLVFADNVLEHIDEPVPVFHEVYRVLKVGGAFLAKTPNRSHYVATIARLTPHRFHQWVNQKRGRSSADTFPTRYKANSPQDILQLGQLAGFGKVSTELFEGRPEYLRGHLATYLAGLAYERAVNKLESLAKFRVVLIAQLEKN